MEHFKMRPLFFAATALGVTLTAAGCASMDNLGESFTDNFADAGNFAGNVVNGIEQSFQENFGQAPQTPMTVVTWSEAPAGPYQAKAGEHVITQYIAPSYVVELTSEAAPDRGVGPAALDAGTKLFGVVGRNGAMRYCAAPEEFTETAQPALTCLEDADGDGAFETAWTALGYDEAFAFAVRRWSNRYALAAPAGYLPSDPALGPLRQIAIEYVGRGRDDTYGFALNVGGRDAFTPVGGAARTSWIAPEEGVIDIAGAKIEILDTTRRGQIIYRLGSAIDQGELTLQVSNAQRSFGALALADSSYSNN